MLFEFFLVLQNLEADESLQEHVNILLGVIDA